MDRKSKDPFDEAAEVRPLNHKFDALKPAIFFVFKLDMEDTICCILTLKVRLPLVVFPLSKSIP